MTSLDHDPSQACRADQASVAERLPRPLVVVINERPGDAEQLCQLLECRGLSTQIVGLAEFLAPRTALALLLGPRVASILVDVRPGDTTVCWQRLCVVRRLARLCGVPFVITTPNRGLLTTAVGPTTVIEVASEDGLETFATAVTRFVRAEVSRAPRLGAMVV